MAGHPLPSCRPTAHRRHWRCVDGDDLSGLRDHGVCLTGFVPRLGPSGACRHTTVLVPGRCTHPLRPRLRPRFDSGRWFPCGCGVEAPLGTWGPRVVGVVPLSSPTRSLAVGLPYESTHVHRPPCTPEPLRGSLLRTHHVFYSETPGVWLGSCRASALCDGSGGVGGTTCGVSEWDRGGVESRCPRVGARRAPAVVSGSLRRNCA